MTVQLSDVVVPLTRAEVEQATYDAIAARGTNVTRWRSGSIVRTLIKSAAIVLSALSAIVAGLASSAFLALATGDWLTLLCRYVYGVERVLATAAAGEVTLTNGGGGVYALDPGDLIVSTAEGVQYRNTEAVALGAMGSQVVSIVAVETGSSGSTAADTITELVTPLDGVTCTNTDPLVGTDDETDAELRARAAESLGATSPMGPWDAYAYAARNATRTDGTLIGVNRVSPPEADGDGGLTFYVFGASGALTGTVDDPETDLGAVMLAMDRGATPLGITLTVDNAAEVEVDVTAEIWIFDSGSLVVADLENEIEVALATYLSTVPIGGIVVGANPGKVFVESLRRVITSVDDQIFDIDLTLPAGDTTLASDEAPVMGTLTLTVNRVAPQGVA